MTSEGIQGNQQKEQEEIKKILLAGATRFKEAWIRAQTMGNGDAYLDGVRVQLLQPLHGTPYGSGKPDRVGLMIEMFYRVEAELLTIQHVTSIILVQTDQTGATQKARPAI